MTARIQGQGIALFSLSPLIGSSQLYTPPGSGVRMVLGDGDYPLLKTGHSGQQRHLPTQFGEAVNTSAGLGRWTIDSGTGTLQALPGVGTAYVFNTGSTETTWAGSATIGASIVVSPTSAHANGCLFIAITSGTTGSSEPTWPNVQGATVVDNTVTWLCLGTITPASAIVPLRVHHGAVLTNVILYLQVGHAHAAVPAVFPKVRVSKLAKATGAITWLKNDATVVSGFLSATAANGTAWYAAGATQSITYTCDANTVIDTSSFTYHAEIVDEAGANAWSHNRYTELFPQFDSIADIRPS